MEWGSGAYATPPSPAPWGKTNLGMSWLGVPHSLMVNSMREWGTPNSMVNPQGLQQLLALLPLRSCWDGSHGLGCAMLPVPCWQPSCAWAGICQGTIDTHVLPTCFVPILQGAANMAMATIRSLTLPSPSTSPGTSLSPSPKPLARCWLAKAHLLQHGWWPAGPARGQGRAASSWVSLLRLCGLEHGRAPAASSVCSACPGGESKQPKVGTGERGRDDLPPSFPHSPRRTGGVCRGTGSVSSSSPAPVQGGHCSESGQGQQIVKSQF